MGSRDIDGSEDGFEVVGESVGIGVVGLEVGFKLGKGVGLPGKYVGDQEGGIEGSGVTVTDGSGLGISEGSSLGTWLNSREGIGLATTV